MRGDGLNSEGSVTASEYGIREGAEGSAYSLLPFSPFRGSIGHKYGERVTA